MDRRKHIGIDLFQLGFFDETLKDELETYVGNVGEYTIRLSDTKKSCGSRWLCNL